MYVAETICESELRFLTYVDYFLYRLYLKVYLLSNLNKHFNFLRKALISNVSRKCLVSFIFAKAYFGLGIY